MLRKLKNAIIDRLARSETLDLYFVVSDLIDIPCSEIDRREDECYDSLATQSVDESGIDPDTINGRTVI